MNETMKLVSKDFEGKLAAKPKQKSAKQATPRKLQHAGLAPGPTKVSSKNLLAHLHEVDGKHVQGLPEIVKGLHHQAEQVRKPSQRVTVDRERTPPTASKAPATNSLLAHLHEIEPRKRNQAEQEEHTRPMLAPVPQIRSE